MNPMIHNLTRRPEKERLEIKSDLSSLCLLPNVELVSMENCTGYERSTLSQQLFTPKRTFASWLRQLKQVGAAEFL